jgi:ribonuclease-3
LPEYRVVRTEGVEHAQHFVVACATAHEARVVYGSGSSRRRAEQDAARRLLEDFDRRGTDE